MASSKKDRDTADSAKISKAVSSLARPAGQIDDGELEQPDKLTGFGLRREMHSEGNRGYMEFALASPYLTVMRSAFTASTQHNTVATAERDILRIRLGLAGKMGIDDGVSSSQIVDAPTCLLVAQPKDQDLATTVLPLEHYRFVGFILPRGVLIETWGFDQEVLPEPLRSFELGQLNDVNLVKLAMSSELISIATDILKCGFSGPLLDQYLESKAREAMCFIIAALQPPDDELTEDGDEALKLTKRDRERLAEARLIIDEHYVGPPGIKALSRRVGLNRNKLCAGFRAAYGLSIHEYARELRLQKALELLREGSISITEVAELVGYGHSSSLTTAIKRRFGLSPRQLRK